MPITSPTPVATPTPTIRCWMLFVFIMLAALPITHAVTGADAAGPRVSEVPLIGRPCEGCEAAFDGVPGAIPTRLALRAPDGPGEPMVLTGTVRDGSSVPRPGIVLYVYQTDHAGEYPPHAGKTTLGPSARRHGALRGWVQTDAAGRYAIDTVRPGGYPGTDIPQHIHLQVIEPGCFTYFIDDVMFRDDPRLTPALERQLAHGAGGDGVVMPERIEGTWRASRDIVLGLAIPGYRACEAPSHAR